MVASNSGRLFYLPLLACLLTGCAGTKLDPGRYCVAGKLHERAGHQMGQPPCAGEVALAPGVSLEDDLTEDEAITVALWNNAAFQEALVDLNLTRADLIDARLLPNPEFWYLNPVGVKQLEYAIEFPIEVLWLRPFRIASARLENERTCERLVQLGLDLIRDVRQAYYDVLLAQGRLRVAEESVRIRGHVAELAEARLKAGDASPLETATARIDGMQARQDAVRVRYDVALAEERLRNLLGIGASRCPLVLDGSVSLPRDNCLDVDALTEEAMSTRPDAVAASQAAAAAGERARLARISWFRFFGIIDANGQGLRGHEIGPGFRVSIPIFNRGQGGIARTEADLERTMRNQVTVQNQIILDVRRAFVQHQQAHSELILLEQKVRPEVEAAIRRAEKAYKEGSASYLIVLETTRQLLDSHLREAQLQADLRRAWAELERSVGRRLALPLEPPELVKPPRLEDPIQL